MSDSPPSISPSPLPTGLSNAYGFQLFNSMSWSLIIGTPILLFMKEMGASGLTLGITVALNPLFSFLQIPAANIAERVGYKPFVLRGWKTRSYFILGAALVPLLPETVIPSPWKIRLVLLSLAGFAAARGLSMCGYLPWLTQLIPEDRRGRFLAIDTLFIYIATMVTMLGSSAVLRWFPSSRTYAFLFVISFLFALISLYFLKRIPDPPPSPPALRNATRPPWGAMIRYGPFTRILIFVLLWNIAVGGMGVVWVPFMRDAWTASSSLILAFSAYSSVMAAAGSFLVGPLADRTGSRPLIAVGSALVLLSQVGWLGTAVGLLPRSISLALLATLSASIGFSIQGIATTRLLMGTVPATGRSHFFAIHSVTASLSLGLTPLLWGAALDALKALEDRGLLPRGHGWEWNRFALLYAAIVLGLLFAQLARRRLLEPRALSTHEALRILLVESPRKLAARVLITTRRFRPIP